MLVLKERAAHLVRVVGDDGEQTLHAVGAAGENDISARLGKDPWAVAGLLQIGAIEPWALWLDSRSGNRAP